MEQVSIELFNIKFHADVNVTACIKLVNEDGIKEIGLYSDSINKKNVFKYIGPGSSTIIQDDTVGYIKDLMKFRFMSYSTSDTYAVRPKNLRLAVMPTLGYAHIFENSVPSYTRRDLNSTTVNTDWSGRWKFVIQSSGFISMSGVEIMIQQNI